MSDEIDYQLVGLWVIGAMFSFILLLAVIASGHQRDKLNCVSVESTLEAGIIIDSSTGELKQDCRANRSGK